MKTFSLLIGLILIPGITIATDRWNFERRIAVTQASRSGVFHHLEGAGRKHIATSHSHIAVAWEDNSSSEPQVYVVVKGKENRVFSKPHQISSGHDAYEPSIAAVVKDQFVVTWEQDGEVLIKSFSADSFGDTVKLSSSSAGHASITSDGSETYVVWREQQDHKWYLWVAKLKLDNNKITILSKQTVEQQPLGTPILYPTISLSAGGLCVAWEDRRTGHTVLLLSYSPSSALHFSTPENLNEFFSERNAYDKGNGVTRVSITAFAKDEFVAAWMDKRRRGGYGIFSSLVYESGAAFGPNEKVHGKKGDKLSHYNPATAGNSAGDFVIAWDDYRNGDSDIWLSTITDDDEWSQDHTPAVATGAKEQSHPAIALDEQGVLHLVWIERNDLNAPSQLWYSSGVPVNR